jgi:hypothetical protein
MRLGGVLDEWEEMQTWRLALLSLLLCTTWVGCSDAPEPTPDGGTAVDAGNTPADSGSDAGTNPADSGSDGGTGPADSGTDGGSSGGDAGTDAGPPDNSVRVRRFIRNLTASGFVEQPEDFARNPVELFVEDGDTLVPVTGRAGGPGEYIFPDVPRVTYYLKLGTNYVVMDSRNVDLSVDLLGRADAVTLPTASVASVALSGLEPWFVSNPPGTSNPANPSSELQLISEQVGLSAELDSTTETGMTSVNEENVPVSTSSGPMVHFEAEKGDRGWVVQLNPRTLGALSDGGTQNYLTAVRHFQLPPFSHDGGQPLRVEGTLQSTPMNALSLDWRISSFAAHAAEVHPSATIRSNRLIVFPAAYGPAEGWVGYSGELLRLERPREDPSNVEGLLVYGNPYPSSWGVLADASTSFSVLFTIPNEQPFRATAAIDVSDRPSVLAAGAIVPRIRPPRNLTLDGTEAYTARTVAAGAHVLAWQPPAAGTPDAYVVNLRRLDKQGNSPFRFSMTVGNIYVDGSVTSARVPAGILQPGQLYYLTVRSVLADGYDVSAKPFSLGDRIVSSSAATLSGLLTVPAQTP